MMGLDDMKQSLGARQRGLQVALDAIGMIDTTAEAIANMGLAVEVACDGPRVTFSVVLVTGEDAAALKPKKRRKGGAKPMAEAAVAPASDALPAAGPWLEEEIGIALDMSGNGASVSEIAAVLGRKPQGVTLALRRARQRTAAGPASAKPVEQIPTMRPEDLSDPTQAPAAEPKAEPAPQPKPAPAPEPEPVPQAEPVGGSSAEWTAHVASLPYGEGWSLQDDIRLCEGLMCGDGLSMVAERLGADRDDLKARWLLLNRNQRPTIKGQEKLLAALRARKGNA